MKKIIILAVAIAVMAIGTTVALASDLFKSPAEIVSELTGKTVDEAVEARLNGVTYGAQAAAVGKLEEFKNERLEQCKLMLSEAVKSGSMTQAEADEYYAAMQARMAACDGTGAGRSFGRGPANGYGCGFEGMTNGRGSGCGFGRGACHSQTPAQ